MSLTKCDECGGEVASTAWTCPHCGVRHPGRSGASCLAEFCMGFFGFFFVIWLFVTCIETLPKGGDESMATTTPKADAATSQKKVVAKHPHKKKHQKRADEEDATAAEEVKLSDIEVPTE